MQRRVIVATMWTGARLIVPWHEVNPPTDGALNAIAERLVYENGGAKPTVRVVAMLPWMVPQVFEDGERPEDQRATTIIAPAASRYVDGSMLK